MDERTARIQLDRLVEELRRQGIKDDIVLTAMAQLPRHLFVPEAYREQAYQDRPLPIGEGQTISQPYMVALMTSLLDPHPGDRVLEIGTGSGYQAAVLSLLVGEVFTIERVRGLHDRVSRLFTSPVLGEYLLGAMKKIRLRLDDGSIGLPHEAPFDGIIVTAAAPDAPRPLLDQLADGGRLVIPVGTQQMQKLRLIRREGERFEEEKSIACVFVPLLGRYGFPGYP